MSFYFFDKKTNTPLVYGTIGRSNDQQVVVIAVGNKGSEKKITDVLVNNDKQPTTEKVQVSDPWKGFIITDSFNERVKSKYGIKNVKSVTLQPHTSPIKQLKKFNNGHLNKNAVSYGLNIINDKPINKVIIEYRYSGSSFEKTIQLKSIPIHDE